MIYISLGLIVIGLIIISIGLSIRRRGETSFIAGNNVLFVPKNEKKLAERIGLVLSTFGFVTVMFPIVYQLVDGVEGYYYAVIAVIHLLSVFILMMLDQLEL